MSLESKGKTTEGISSTHFGQNIYGAQIHFVFYAVYDFDDKNSYTVQLNVH